MDPHFTANGNNTANTAIHADFVVKDLVFGHGGDDFKQDPHCR